MKRTRPTTESWAITPETIFTEEREFHGTDEDIWLIEVFDLETETWSPCESLLRLTRQGEWPS